MEATEGLDKNIPLYIFALGSFVVTVFTIFWALIKHTREADMVLHKRVNDSYEKNLELTKEVYYLKGKLDSNENNNRSSKHT